MSHESSKTGTSSTHCRPNPRLPRENARSWDKITSASGGCVMSLRVGAEWEGIHGHPQSNAADSWASQAGVLAWRRWLRSLRVPPSLTRFHYTFDYNGERLAM